MKATIKISAELTDGTTFVTTQTDEFEDDAHVNGAVRGMLVAIVKMGGILDFDKSSAAIIPLCNVKSRIVAEVISASTLSTDTNVNAAKAANDGRAAADALLRFPGNRR